VKNVHQRKEGHSHWLADLWLQLIAGFKLLKATLLVLGGIAAVGLLNPETARAMTRWAMDLERVTAIKLEVLMVNVAIVAYLVWRVGARLDEVEEEPPAHAVG
jgi:hypothetical protein